MEGEEYVIEFSIDGVAVAQMVSVVVLPLLVAVVANRLTGAGRAWLLAGLALVSSLLAEAVRTWQAGGSYDVGVGLLAALPVFIGSVAAYYGFLKPTGVAGAVQGVVPPRTPVDGEPSRTV